MRVSTGGQGETSLRHDFEAEVTGVKSREPQGVERGGGEGVARVRLDPVRPCLVASIW